MTGATWPSTSPSLRCFDSKRIFYLIGPAWFVAVEVMFYLFIAVSLTATIRYCRLAQARKLRLLAVTAPALLLIGVSWGFKAWELLVIHVPANHWPTWFGPLAWADNPGFGMLVATAWVAAEWPAPQPSRPDRNTGQRWNLVRGGDGVARSECGISGDVP